MTTPTSPKPTTPPNVKPVAIETDSLDTPGYIPVPVPTAESRLDVPTSGLTISGSEIESLRLHKQDQRQEAIAALQRAQGEVDRLSREIDTLIKIEDRSDADQLYPITIAL